MGIFQSTPEPPPDNGSGILIILILFILIAMANKDENATKKKKKTKKEKPKDILDAVIGLESVKEEIRYYMDFIKNREKYKEWDVKLPKGILLAGPPGTGKTLLVKTMAKKLDIPLVSASGSEFIEMYVGVGARRVRDLFAKAKGKKKLYHLYRRNRCGWSKKKR